jgi:hypothetical protein
MELLEPPGLASKNMAGVQEGFGRALVLVSGKAGAIA